MAPLLIIQYDGTGHVNKHIQTSLLCDLTNKLDIEATIFVPSV